MIQTIVGLAFLAVVIILAVALVVTFKYHKEEKTVVNDLERVINAQKDERTKVEEKNNTLENENYELRERLFQQKIAQSKQENPVVKKEVPSSTPKKKVETVAKKPVTQKQRQTTSIDLHSSNNNTIHVSNVASVDAFDSYAEPSRSESSYSSSKSSSYDSGSSYSSSSSDSGSSGSGSYSSGGDF